MRRISTIILLVMLVAHAAFGCCLHHVHSWDEACCEPASPTAAACACDGHQHNASDSADAPSHHDERPRHGCEGDRCVFVKTEQSSEQLTDVLRQFCDVAASQVRIATNERTDIAGDVWLESPAPPLRTHLLNQILLI